MPEIKAPIRKSLEGIHYQVKDDTKQFFSVKDVDTVGRTVAQVLNTFYYLDSQGDVLIPGCVKKSIKEHGPDSASPYKIKHALFHNLTRLPGRFTMLKEGTFTWEGVKYQGIISDSKISTSSEGNDTLINYAEKIYDNHSIGFRYLDYEFVEKDTKEFKAMVKQLINPEAADGREYMVIVKEIELYEGSTVAFGANEMTPALGIKSKEAIHLSFEERMDRLTNYQNKLVNALKNGEQSDEMMRTFELQAAQIKQYINNLFAEIPDVVHKAVDKKDEVKIPAEMNFDNLCSAIKL